MLLHDLLDDLELARRTSSRSEATTGDRRRCVGRARQPRGHSRRAVLLHPRRAHRRPRPRARRGRGRRGRAARRAAARRSTSRRRGSTRCARVLGPLCARFHGDPSRALRVLGVTGTNGKTTTTYLLEAIARADGDRAGVIGTVGARVDGDASSRCATRRPRRPICRRCSRDARPTASTPSRWRCRRTRSTSTASTARASRRRASRISRTTTSTTTATVDAYFEAKARLFDTARSPAAPRSTSTTTHGACSRDARAATRARGLHVRRRRPTADVVRARRRCSTRRHAVRPRRRAHGPSRRRAQRRSSALQRRERARRPPRPRSSSGFSFDADRSPGSARRSGCPGASSASTRASRSPCSSTTRTRPTRWRRCSARRGRSSTAGSCSSCSAAAAIATARSVR